MIRFCTYFCMLFLYVIGENCYDAVPGEKTRDLF